MKLTILILILFNPVQSFCQTKSQLTVSLGAGMLTTPYYLQDKAKGFYSIDLDYYITRRHILSSNFNSGEHDYYDNVLSNTGGSVNKSGTNANAAYQAFSILYKYKILSKQRIDANIGTGAGIMTHSRRYPYAESNSSSYRQSTWTDLVFPVRLEIDIRLSKDFKMGLIGGFYIQPDYPVLACYTGPRITYQLR